MLTSLTSAAVKKEVRIGRIRLYHFYAELIIASFGLNQALERESKALPFAFVHFQTIAIRLIECFEHDLQSKGLIKGCPDFVFTALTYAVVSLLKSTQARYSNLEGSPTNQILLLCRRAADMLAKGAGASEHLPSIQATFLHRLLDIRSAPGKPTKTVAPPRTLNLQAFAESFENRNHETNWPPPAPPSGFVGPAIANAVFEPGPSASGQHIGNDHVPAVNGSQTDNHRTDAPLTFGAEMSFDLNSYLGFPNTTSYIPSSSSIVSGFPTYGQATDGQNPNLDGFLHTTEHLPEIPAASLDLTMGSFMNDQGVMDMLFVNQGLW
ncbi:hypothetical protein QFC22_006435 [Naganishia vaughanmartiniae]|uniref:Uncharacterized protein n=1 Tax=Naganishia vaughanmartiniae TaxID=1424756 RepID=A0ACC2WLS7_9TREE|nr:hypothetical protein QFC22_006435 [Naganishia vaughanmartiniae]